MDLSGHGVVTRERLVMVVGVCEKTRVHQIFRAGESVVHEAPERDTHVMEGRNVGLKSVASGVCHHFFREVLKKVASKTTTWYPFFDIGRIPYSVPPEYHCVG